MESPKGKFRLTGTMIIGILVMVAAVMLDPLSELVGWAATTVLNLGGAIVAVGVYYWVLRTVLHIRTHEVPTENQVMWQMVLMASCAVVFGLALTA